MLVLSRTLNTALIIDGEILVTVIGISFDQSEIKFSVTMSEVLRIRNEDDNIKLTKRRQIP